MTATVPAVVRHDEVVRNGLRTIAELAVALVDGCDSAAVVVADDDGRLVALADVGGVDLEADAVADAARMGRSQCVDEPVAWMAVPLLAGRTVLGVFALRGDAGTFADRRAQRVGDDVAQHAALAVAAACLSARGNQLSALVDDARDVVDQAHGVIMARKGCSPEAAAVLLASDAAREGRTLDQMAASVVASTRPG